MDHLYRMGESSAAFHREMSVGKDTMLAAAAIYQGIYFMYFYNCPTYF